ncbi:MAG TPA: FixH family protein [Terriglobales bacterium]|nr:FixH family protein [Terriglobales bacterium]
MTTREKKFLFGGIGAGVLGAVLVLGAFVIPPKPNAGDLGLKPEATGGAPAADGQHEHGAVSPKPGAGLGGAPASETVGAVQLSPDELNAAGVQLAEVGKQKIRTDVDAFGRVEQPEAQLSVIPARIAGRIDRLFVQYTGEKVRRGQAVAEVYSPEVATALEEYRLAQQSRAQLANARPEAVAQANQLVEASRQRLELWGIAEKQIDSPRSTHVTIYSPSGGTVVERKVAGGQYVNAGETLFTLADLSTVWVKAEVYESQLPQIQAGQAVELRSDSLPNQVIHGKVEFVEPSADLQTRTIPVHVHVPNPGMKLVPGMYVRALFTSVGAKEQVVVPRSAVLDTGTRRLVYVATGGGAFEARDVEIGAAAGEVYPVLRGLQPGEKVVTNGNFLIDSQTRLSGGMSGLFGGSKEFQKEAGGGKQEAGGGRQEAGGGRQAAAQSAKISFTVDPNPPKGAQEASFSVTLTDAAGKPIPDAKVKVTLVMPAMPSMNMPEMRSSFELPWMAAHGMYMGPGNVPMAGPWNVTVEASRDGQAIASYRTRLTAR